MYTFMVILGVLMDLGVEICVLLPGYIPALIVGLCVYCSPIQDLSLCVYHPLSILSLFTGPPERI